MSDRRFIGEMRQRLGLKAHDTSLDKEIEAMTPEKRLELLCGWNIGDPNWAQAFLSWADDAGYKITEKRSRP